MLSLIRSALAGKVKEIAIGRSGWELLALLSDRGADLPTIRLALSVELVMWLSPGEGRAQET